MAADALGVEASVRNPLFAAPRSGGKLTLLWAGSDEASQLSRLSRPEEGVVIPLTGPFLATQQA